MPNPFRWSAAVCVVLSTATADAGSFRVLPYIQNPATDAMTVRWLSNSEESGTLTVTGPDCAQTLHSDPVRGTALAYNPFAEEPGGPHPALPWIHTVRVRGLKSATRYNYSVRQGGETHQASFRTAPSHDDPIRFVAYSDPETEPESSTSPPVDWPAHRASNRPEGITKYLVDQTVGYRENLKVIASRKPDFVLIAGDLVETGGEQRDWDEFWRHNAGDLGQIASTVPVLPSLGNHENYAGRGGGYSAEGANFSTAKYLTYFDVPDNGASAPQKGRYYRIDYGPVTLIVLDSSDGLPNQTASDTNHNLVGSTAPDFNPGSEQYRWLERQLADAQAKARFTFVQFHHTSYGSGPHSIPFGKPNFSGQSGIAMRVLQPLLFRYGVDAVISGHDEMLERSMVSGTETLPDGTTRPHDIHFYDVGIGGDGLRGPSEGFDNPYRKFLAHDDLPEKWNGRQLICGGKHYGHIEVNVAKNEDGLWQARIVPVQVFPLTDSDGKVTGFERRTLDDVVVVTSEPVTKTSSLVPAPLQGIDTSNDRTGPIAAVLVAMLAGVALLNRVISGRRGGALAVRSAG